MASTFTFLFHVSCVFCKVFGFMVSVGMLTRAHLRVSSDFQVFFHPSIVLNFNFHGEGWLNRGKKPLKAHSTCSLLHESASFWSHHLLPSRFTGLINPAVKKISHLFPVQYLSANSAADVVTQHLEYLLMFWPLYPNSLVNSKCWLVKPWWPQQNPLSVLISWMTAAYVLFKTT